MIWTARSPRPRPCACEVVHIDRRCVRHARYPAHMVGPGEPSRRPVPVSMKAGRRRDRYGGDLRAAPNCGHQHHIPRRVVWRSGRTRGAQQRTMSWVVYSPNWAIATRWGFRIPRGRRAGLLLGAARSMWTYWWRNAIEFATVAPEWEQAGHHGVRHSVMVLADDRRSMWPAPEQSSTRPWALSRGGDPREEDPYRDSPSTPGHRINEFGLRGLRLRGPELTGRGHMVMHSRAPNSAEIHAVCLSNAWLLHDAQTEQALAHALERALRPLGASDLASD